VTHSASPGFRFRAWGLGTSCNKHTVCMCHALSIPDGGIKDYTHSRTQHTHTQTHTHARTHTHTHTHTHIHTHTHTHTHTHKHTYTHTLSFPHGVIRVAMMMVKEQGKTQKT
jgi:hypothetical protein